MFSSVYVCPSVCVYECLAAYIQRPTYNCNSIIIIALGKLFGRCVWINLVCQGR